MIRVEAPPVPCIDLKDVLAFVAGPVDPPLRTAIETHLEECDACRDVVLAVGRSRAPASVSSSDDSLTAAAPDGATPRVRPVASAHLLEPSIARGTSVGRYTILEVVGRGGYGEVYAAYDPELDRKIAIKFLHGVRSGGSSAAETRLLREAKAIAKLSHPNIVNVYDAGTFDGRVFVAMEFVDGETLKEWLTDKPRTRAEILDVFKNAARGLAAAHAADLVHRDFKPANVMVRNDGRVLVMDFGTVRQVAGSEDAAGNDRGRPVSALSMEHELDLTRTGELVGTPAYMAPEQFEGDRTDARTDQFSFCVALYGALYGERPFAGEAFLELRASVLQGKIRPPPERAGKRGGVGKNVPTWLRRVLLRGLSVNPAGRFVSMAALLEALEQDPASRRRPWLVGAAVALALAGALGANRYSAHGRASCAAGAARLVGVWEAGGVDSARKQSIAQAFARTGKAYATRTFARTATLLDAYVERWTAMDRDACEATRVRAEQSNEALALRKACLDDRVRDLRALTDIYASADLGVVQNAISAATALPTLDACADLPALRAGKPFDDPALRKRGEELRDRFARVQALMQSGQCAAAAAAGKPLLTDIRATGSRPLLAQVLALMGTLGDNCGDPREAVAWLKEAYFTAEAARLDRLAVEAAGRIPVLAANRLGDLAMARDWLEIMRATLERVGPDDRLQSMLFSAESLYLQSRGDVDTVISAARRSLELSRRALGADHVQTLLIFGNLGEALARAGRLEEALSVDREADEVTVRALGPDHPSVGNLANNEGEVLDALGRFAEAEAQFRRAIDCWSVAGSDKGIVSYGRTGLGIALVGQGRSSEAIAPLETALGDRLERNVSPKLVAETRFALARALWSRPAEHVRARALAKAARADAVDPKVTAAIDAWLAKPG
jgi:tetratricopeptide (TPR) repeat protein/predicted Ser/Thr protein kinase